ncbi:MAG: gliding motility protein GldM [Flavobacteriaceae bacterium]|nr:gliding motility protein GldM [Flavobacteriaceae bacterium]
MAGGKLSARQKMINLMYLVFISMLAMQMSKEVLTAFGYLNQRMTTFNTTQTVKNEGKYAGLAVKATDQPEKFTEINDKAKQVKVLSQELYSHIDEIKELLLGSVEDATNYESMDKSDVLDVYFFKKGKISEEGKQFVDEILKYRNGLEKILGSKYPEVSKLIQQYFDTSDQTDREGITKSWLEYNFVGFPVVASLTKLTVMQSDIRGAERSILNTMLGGQLNVDAGISANTYQAIFMPTKSSFFPGEKVTGQIVLGRYDKTLKPSNVVINGQKIDKSNFKGGGVQLNLRAGRVGENPLKGKFVFNQDGEEIEIPIKTTYSVVARPNEAVISADKMNVVYRGLKNPMTISVPGVADNKIKVSAPGLSKAKGVGKYIMKPRNKGAKVRINVTATLPDGSKMTSSRIYRVKAIPKPLTTVRKESGYVKMPKSSLAKTTVRVELPDFLFDLKFTVVSFKVKVPGQSTIIVKGSKMSARAQAAINRARVGDVIGIFDVKSKVNGVSSRIKDASPVTIEVQ